MVAIQTINENITVTGVCRCCLYWWRGIKYESIGKQYLMVKSNWNTLRC